MKIWLLEDNQKTGPFESFSVRERVADGDLGPDTPAWYDGADGWVTLADVPSMTSAFPRVEEQYQDIVNTDELPLGKDGEAQYRHGVDIPPQLQEPPKLHPIQRLFARMIDVMLYMFLLVGVMVYQGFDFSAPLTPTQAFLYHMPYVLIDGLLMHLLGTTIGKYLLDIRVSTADGMKLSLGASLLRSARVWVIGLGMFTILMPLSFLFSWMISRKFGKFLWDLPKNTHVEVKKLNPVKVIIAVFVIIGAIQLLSLCIPEEMLREVMSWNK